MPYSDPGNTQHFNINVNSHTLEMLNVSVFLKVHMSPTVQTDSLPTEPPGKQCMDLGSIPGLVRSPGEGNGYPLRFSCLENSMDRGASWATVHGVAKSRTQLSD